MICRHQRCEEVTCPIWKSDFLTGVVSTLDMLSVLRRDYGVQWLWLILVDTHRLRSDKILTLIVNLWLASLLGNCTISHLVP